ncbi:MAG TPA: chemotaxis protein, partial [Pseudoduganella sp.]
MSIKRRIWALPVVSTIIFVLGVAVSTSFATGALDSIHATESVDFPTLGAVKALGGEVEAVTIGLRDAVSEGDKA